MADIHPVVAALRAERQRQHISQHTLANGIGRRTAQSIWVWENGGNLTLSSLTQWAAALGKQLTLTDLEDDDDGEPQ